MAQTSTSSDGAERILLMSPGASDGRERIIGRERCGAERPWPGTPVRLTSSVDLVLYFGREIMIKSEPTADAANTPDAFSGAPQVVGLPWRHGALPGLGRGAPAGAQHGAPSLGRGRRGVEAGGRQRELTEWPCRLHPNSDVPPTI